MKSIVTRKEIKKTIETILLDHKFIAPGTEVHERHSYENDCGMGWLDRIEAIMDIEKKYGLFIPDDVAERMDTVARTIDYLYLTLNRL